MGTSPLQTLELQALEQRIRLHKVIADAKIQVEITKQKLNVKNILKKHMLAGIVTACVIGLYSDTALLTWLQILNSRNEVTPVNDSNFA